MFNLLSGISRFSSDVGRLDLAMALVKFSCSHALKIRDSNLLQHNIKLLFDWGKLNECVEYLEKAEQLNVVNEWTNFYLCRLYEYQNSPRWISMVNQILISESSDKNLINQAENLRLNGTRKRFLAHAGERY